jgi:outer membrane protein assembly factor BamB
MVATLVQGHGLIFSLGGYPQRHLLAIAKGGSGDITDTHVVWRTHKGIPYVPSPLLYGDYLHVVSDEGIYTCFDPKTGAVHAKTRLATHVSSSLVGACQRVYVTDDDGDTTVLENGPEGKVLATNSLGENVYSSPAIAGGDLFLRGEEHLFRITDTAAASR